MAHGYKYKPMSYYDHKVGDLVCHRRYCRATAGIVLSVEKIESHGLTAVVWLRFDEDKSLIGRALEHSAMYLAPYELIHGY